ncbi:carboxymuconolactone decarboxylase family protein [Hydrogenovibrio marinus]|uniref:Carboxymuconolactone decarboxylase-like domain-containing protein n=1 Tax=Hydrogenovibrio marinus TaxID=28885 RepID=A0A066ZY13_HYDMR|nr:hypothetical protein [Hydrogenovibrio marinus]KDN95015.1 hypothetical protein EI16_01500 [Hydrogenovibrio marinus]BBN59480.1 alkyl hydroperoxide reductase AhpD [Hydrogenovibrio marinus]
MSLLSLVTPEKATGRVAEIYDEINWTFGSVPNGFQLHSISPELFDDNWRNISYFMEHKTLKFPLLAMIRMLVSTDNACEYCINLNEALLINKAGFTQDQIAATKADASNAPLNEKDKAMLLFVLKATKAAKSVNADDVEALRNLDWTDKDIYDAVAHGARNMAMDVLFDTFKVEL